MITPEKNNSNFAKTTEQELSKILDRNSAEPTPMTTQFMQVADVQMRLYDLLRKNQQENPENLWSLYYLRITPPAFWNAGGHKTELIKNAKKGLMTLFEFDHSIDLLNRLSDATLPEGNPNTNIPLNIGFITSPDLTLVFRELKNAFSHIGEDTDDFENMIQEGKEKGSQYFLTALALPDKPLLPYQKRVAERIMNLEPDYNNRGVSGLLPTRIIGVSAQYAYRESNKAPTISIAVIRKP